MRLKTKVVGVLEDGFKAPYEVAEQLRMRRKRELLRLKKVLNELYANNLIDTFNYNGEKKLYLTRCK